MISNPPGRLTGYNTSSFYTKKKAPKRKLDLAVVAIPPKARMRMR